MTRNFIRMAEMYRHFGREYTTLDWSDSAKAAMFRYESTGGVIDKDRNGFFQGKRAMDITIAMWMEDLHVPPGKPRTLNAWELYLEYPKWFLDKVLPERLHMTDEEITDIRETYERVAA